LTLKTAQEQGAECGDSFARQQGGESMGKGEQGRRRVLIVIYRSKGKGIDIGRRGKRTPAIYGE
jgi:hypothetical protein